MDNSIEFKITDSLFKLIFESNGIICGSSIREYLLPLKENKVYPTVYFIRTKNCENFLKTVKASLTFCFDLVVEQYNKIIDIYLTYKFNNNINIFIHIYPEDYQIPNMYLDINQLSITLPDNYIIPKDTSLINLVNKINAKQFQVIKSFNIPKGNRRQLGIVNSSLNLLYFIQTMYYTTNMLKNGWTLENQKLEEVFEPNMIKEIKYEDNCDICSEKFSRYELELDCCKKVICFKCAINQVKNRFDNSEICCPFCRGDLFGWKTNKVIDKVIDIVDDFDDMPPLENVNDIPAGEPSTESEVLNRMLNVFRPRTNIRNYYGDDVTVTSIGRQQLNTAREYIEHANALNHNVLYGQLGATDTNVAITQQTLTDWHRPNSRQRNASERLRSNLMGARVNFSGRTVITSDSDNNEMEAVD